MDMKCKMNIHSLPKKINNEMLDNKYYLTVWIIICVCWSNYNQAHFCHNNKDNTKYSHIHHLNFYHILDNL